MLRPKSCTRFRSALGQSPRRPTCLYARKSVWAGRHAHHRHHFEPQPHASQPKWPGNEVDYSDRCRDEPRQFGRTAARYQRSNDWDERGHRHQNRAKTPGLGFAIPVNRIRQIVPQLIAHGKVMRADIGIVAVKEMDKGLADREGEQRRAGRKGWPARLENSATSRDSWTARLRRRAAKTRAAPTSLWPSMGSRSNRLPRSWTRSRSISQASGRAHDSSAKAVRLQVPVTLGSSLGRYPVLKILVAPTAAVNEPCGEMSQNSFASPPNSMLVFCLARNYFGGCRFRLAGSSTGGRKSPHFFAEKCESEATSHWRLGSASLAFSANSTLAAPFEHRRSVH